MKKKIMIPLFFIGCCMFQTLTCAIHCTSLHVICPNEKHKTIPCTYYFLRGCFPKGYSPSFKLDTTLADKDREAKIIKAVEHVCRNDQHPEKRAAEFYGCEMKITLR